MPECGSPCGERQADGDVLCSAGLEAPQYAVRELFGGRGGWTRRQARLVARPLTLARGVVSVHGVLLLVLMHSVPS